VQGRYNVAGVNADPARSDAGEVMLETPAPRPARRPAEDAGLVARWAAENPRSREHFERARRVLPGGVSHEVRRTEPFPLAVESAAGAHKRDLDGHDLVCYVMGHGSLLLGHAHPEVAAAVARQAAHSFHLGASHALEATWAESVTELVPSAERVRFTSSGTEASLLALRLARAATGRDRIVKVAGHFHGWHDQVSYGADAPFSGPDSAGVPAELARGVVVVPAQADAVAAVLEPHDVAAFVLEPSGAAWGTVPLPDGFLEEIRRVADRTGTVLVFDEVVSGFRWAPGGVQALAGVRPDLTILGKILAGGLPGGAVAGRAELMDLLACGRDDPRAVVHPGTHNGHPLSAAAGVAMLSLVSSGEAGDRAAQMAAALRDELTGVFDSCGVAGQAYGASSTFHLLLGRSEPAGELSTTTLKVPPRPELSAGLHCGMLLEGVHLFHGSGFLSSEHTWADVERTADALRSTLRQLRAEGLV
jgi:glutamate-1-semialdehyde 2,1-aminomutase